MGEIVRLDGCRRGRLAPLRGAARAAETGSDVGEQLHLGILDARREHSKLEASVVAS